MKKRKKSIKYNELINNTDVSCGLGMALKNITGKLLLVIIKNYDYSSLLSILLLPLIFSTIISKHCYYCALLLSLIIIVGWRTMSSQSHYEHITYVKKKVTVFFFFFSFYETWFLEVVLVFCLYLIWKSNAFYNTLRLAWIQIFSCIIYSETAWNLQYSSTFPRKYTHDSETCVTLGYNRFIV